MVKKYNLTPFLLFAVLVISMILQSSMYLGWDVSWRFHVTQQFLSGGNYVTDFFDINPPILLYHLIPAVLLSKWFHINSYITVRVFVYIFGLTSLWLCHKTAKPLFKAGDNWAKTCFITVLSIIFFILPAMAFGEREHLLLIFTIPYFLYVALLLTGRTVNRSLSIWIGIFSGIGFITDITFFILFILIELILAYMNRMKSLILRADNLTVLTILVLYLLSIILITPNYIKIILPMIFFLYTPVAHASYKAMLFNNTAIAFFLTLVFFPFHLKRSHLKSILFVFVIAMFFSYICFFLARKNWYFHMLPTISFSFLLLTLYLVEDMRNIRHFRSTSMKKETRLLLVTIATYAILLLFPVRDIFVYNRASFHYGTDLTRLSNNFSVNSNFHLSFA